MTLTNLAIAWVQSSICLGAGLLLCLVFRQQSAAKLLICRATLVATILVVCASPFISTRPNPVVPINFAASSQDATIKVKETATPPTDAEPVPTPTGATPSPVPTEQESNNGPLIYFGGFILAISMQCAGAVALRSIKKRSVLVKNDHVTDRVAAIAMQANVTIPTIYSAPASMTPFVTGMVRKTIFLPMEWLRNQDDIIVDAILAHEIAHISGRDLEWSLFGRIVCSFLWCNPFAWIIYRQLNIAAEDRCDQQVIESGVEQTQYARTLVTIQERFRIAQMQGIAIGAVTHRSNLSRRIHSILSDEIQNRRPPTFTSKAALGSVVMISALLASGLVAQPTRSPMSGAQLSRSSIESMSQKEQFGPIKLKDGSVAKLEYLYRTEDKDVSVWQPNGQPFKVNPKELAEDIQPGNSSSLRALIRITNCPKTLPNVKLKFVRGQISAGATQILDPKKHSVRLWIRTSKLDSDKGMLRLGVPYGSYRTIAKGQISALKLEKDTVGNPFHSLPFPKELIEPDQLSYKDFVVIGRDSAGKKIIGGCAFNGYGFASSGKWRLQLMFNELKDRKVVENKAVKTYEIQAREVQTVDFTGIHLTPNSK